MNKSKRIIALMLAAVMALSLCGCKKKKKDEVTAQPVATAQPNEVFEVKITMDNLWDYFYFKEYRTDVRSETDSKILSCQIAYGLQLKEIYTMMRYLQHNTLEKKHLNHFDAWASTFGETTTAIELAPEGYTLVGR